MVKIGRADGVQIWGSRPEPTIDDDVVIGSSLVFADAFLKQSSKSMKSNFIGYLAQ